MCTQTEDLANNCALRVGQQRLLPHALMKEEMNTSRAYEKSLIEYPLL